VSPQFYNKEKLDIYRANGQNGKVEIEVVNKDSDCPTTSQYMNKITSSGTSKPGLGGFAREHVTSKANGVFYHVIVAKIPVGYSIFEAHNQCGDGATFKWLTSQKGTGQWETYIEKITCGSTGTFNTFGYAFLARNGVSDPWSEYTLTEPVTWYVGYSDIFDATDVSESGSTFTYGDGNAFLAARWRANDYTISYNANGGTGEMSATSMRYDTAATLPENVFTCKNYTFTGWNTKPDGSGTAYADKASVKNLTDENGATVTLYAQWERTVSTETTIEKYDSYSLISVKVNRGSAPSKIILAAYKGDTLVNIQTRAYSKENETFAVTDDFDLIKVMVWDEDTLEPISEVEAIKIN